MNGIDSPKRHEGAERRNSRTFPLCTCVSVVKRSLQEHGLLAGGAGGGDGEAGFAEFGDGF
jgi:hypothetical protein